MAGFHPTSCSYHPMYSYKQKWNETRIYPLYHVEAEDESGPSRIKCPWKLRASPAGGAQSRDANWTSKRTGVQDGLGFLVVEQLQSSSTTHCKDTSATHEFNLDLPVSASLTKLLYGLCCYTRLALLTCFAMCRGP